MNPDSDADNTESSNTSTADAAERSLHQQSPDNKNTELLDPRIAKEMAREFSNRERTLANLARSKISDTPGRYNSPNLFLMLSQTHLGLSDKNPNITGNVRGSGRADLDQAADPDIIEGETGEDFSRVIGVDGGYLLRLGFLIDGPITQRLKKPYRYPMTAYTTDYYFDDKGNYGKVVYLPQEAVKEERRKILYDKGIAFVVSDMTPGDFELVDAVLFKLEQKLKLEEFETQE